MLSFDIMNSYNIQSLSKDAVSMLYVCCMYAILMQKFPMIFQGFFIDFPYKSLEKQGKSNDYMILKEIYWCLRKKINVS
jgi:hypothetical protein